MIVRVGFHPDAKREMREAADFYDFERAGLGTEFLDAVERAMRQVIEHPDSSPVIRGHVRKCRVPRFPYSIVYSVRDRGIFVSAVAHDSRRPFYWRDRL
ncbi:MAG: type II toxin-antitoxin system RelE/ParE family toxin [Thermoleophilia bacterium]